MLKQPPLVLSSLLLVHSLGSPGHAASLVTFSVPGGTGTTVSDINRNSIVIGSYTSNNIDHGYSRTYAGVYTTIDVPGNVDNTTPGHINVYGAIAGTFYKNGTSPTRGFLRNTDGSIETFDAPGAGTVFGVGTFPASINPSNAIVGVSVANDDFTRTGWLRNPDGSFVELSVPGSGVTIPGGINDAGTVTGYYSATATGPAHGFVMSADGSFTLFDVPGASATLAGVINGSGTIAGNCVINGVSQGFVRDAGGSFTTFGAPPGAEFSNVQDLNENGEITGNAIIPGAHGFTDVGYIRSAAGSETKFLVPGEIVMEVSALNNRGVVAGDYNTASTSMGFLRIP
jgi:hypothetical protein